MPTVQLTRPVASIAPTLLLRHCILGRSLSNRTQLRNLPTLLNAACTRGAGGPEGTGGALIPSWAKTVSIGRAALAGAVTPHAISASTLACSAGSGGGFGYCCVAGAVVGAALTDCFLASKREGALHGSESSKRSGTNRTFQQARQSGQQRLQREPLNELSAAAVRPVDQRPLRGQLRFLDTSSHLLARCAIKATISRTASAARQA